ncbi:MAG: chromate transporter, partial [Armatimonadetes bacterium]|nr:chromate transporter [Armatimonadota bacterium]
MSPLASVAVMFATLSLLALGGGTAIVPQMHSEAVRHYHWLTDQQFVDLYAITNVVPGPSSMIVCAIGYAGAGVPGALVATVAMFLPSSLLTYFAAAAWNKFRETATHKILEDALAPVAVGL